MNIRNIRQSKEYPHEGGGGTSRPSKPTKRKPDAQGRVSGTPHAEALRLVKLLEGMMSGMLANSPGRHKYIKKLLPEHVESLEPLYEFRIFLRSHDFDIEESRSVLNRILRGCADAPFLRQDGDEIMDFVYFQALRFIPKVQAWLNGRIPPEALHEFGLNAGQVFFCLRDYMQLMAGEHDDFDFAATLMQSIYQCLDGDDPYKVLDFIKGISRLHPDLSKEKNFEPVKIATTQKLLGLQEASFALRLFLPDGYAEQRIQERKDEFYPSQEGSRLWGEAPPYATWIRSFMSQGTWPRNEFLFERFRQAKPYAVTRSARMAKQIAPDMDWIVLLDFLASVPHPERLAGFERIARYIPDENADDLKQLWLVLRSYRLPLSVDPRLEVFEEEVQAKKRAKKQRRQTPLLRR